MGYPEKSDMDRTEALRNLKLHLRESDTPVTEEDIIKAYQKCAIKTHPYNNGLDSMESFNRINQSFSTLMEIPSFHGEYRYLDHKIRTARGSIPHQLLEIIHLDYPIGILNSGIMLLPDRYKYEKNTEWAHQQYKQIRIETDQPCQMIELAEGAFLGTFADQKWRLIVGEKINVELSLSEYNQMLERRTEMKQKDVIMEDINRGNLNYFGSEAESFLVNKLLKKVYGQKDWVDLKLMFDDDESVKKVRETAEGGLEIVIKSREKHGKDIDFHTTIPKRNYEIMKVLNESRYGQSLQNLIGSNNPSYEPEEYSSMTEIANKLIEECKYEEAEQTLREFQNKYHLDGDAINESLLKCYQNLKNPVGIITTIQRMRKRSPGIRRKGLIYQIAEAFKDINEPEVAASYYKLFLSDNFEEIFDNIRYFPEEVSRVEAYDNSLKFMMNYFSNTDRDKAYELIGETIPSEYPSPNSGWMKIRNPSITEYLCHLHRGILLFEDEKYQESRGDLEIAAMYAQTDYSSIDEAIVFRNSEQEAEIRLKLGIAYHKSDQLDAAKEQFNKVLELNYYCEEARELLEEVSENNVISFKRVRV
jgi:hypothetical protein